MSNLVFPYGFVLLDELNLGVFEKTRKCFKGISQPVGAMICKRFAGRTLTRAKSIQLINEMVSSLRKAGQWQLSKKHCDELGEYLFTSLKKAAKKYRVTDESGKAKSIAYLFSSNPLERTLEVGSLEKVGNKQFYKEDVDQNLSTIAQEVILTNVAYSKGELDGLASNISRRYFQAHTQKLRKDRRSGLKSAIRMALENGANKEVVVEKVKS